MARSCCLHVERGCNHGLDMTGVADVRYSKAKYTARELRSTRVQNDRFDPFESSKLRMTKGSTVCVISNPGDSIGAVGETTSMQESMVSVPVGEESW